MQPGEVVTWVKVQKPVFDLAGVLVSALGLTGVLALVALALGIAFGVVLILRRRQEPEDAFASAVSLGLRS